MLNLKTMAMLPLFFLILSGCSTKPPYVVSEIKSQRDEIPKVLLTECETPVSKPIKTQADVADFSANLWMALRFCKIKHDAIRELEETRVKKMEDSKIK